MKIKIIDFLMAMGEICVENAKCKDCPFNININGIHECTIETPRMRNKEIAQHVKDVTIKYMLSKEGSKNE